MDEFMKDKIMRGTDFTVNEATGDIYYFIPGVVNYYLRHDGRIVHYEDNEVEVIQNLSDCYFDNFDEACNFMKFFGACASNERPDIFYVGNAAESENKVFDDLIRYANTRDIEIISDVLIVADEITMGHWIYRPMISKDCSFDLNEITDSISIKSVMSLVLKPIPELPNCYRITGCPVQKMIQLTLNQSSISSNTILKFVIEPMDIDHVSRIMNFRFYSVEQIVFALKCFGAKDVMAYNDFVKYNTKEYPQQYIRYFNKDDDEITLFITEESTDNPLQKVYRIHELI